MNLPSFFRKEHKHNKYIIPGLLTLFVLIALLLHTVNYTFPCLNSDEAAFGYNAYSILKTGKDEYGIMLPDRFKSFGEFKLPVMGYLSIPFIAIMGLNEVSTRMVVYLIGITSPILFYFLAKELTGKKDIGVIAAFLAAISPWIQITSRHAHEAVVAYFFITLSFLFFLKFSKDWKLKNLILFSIFHAVALFSHHITKPFTVFFCIWLAILIFMKKGVKKQLLGKIAIIVAIPIAVFIVTEFAHPTTRISNLLFYKTAGFQLAIDEQRAEHNNRLLHNKFTRAVTTLTNQYISYFSPEFLVVSGDNNERFGMKGISLISIIEYLFLFVGIFYLFREKVAWRYFILALLFFSPLSASISWQEYSMTRAFYMIVPLILIISFGIWKAWEDSQKVKYQFIGTIVLALVTLFFVTATWDFYLYHYPKRYPAMRAWQCGYKELGDYIKENYDRFDTFYITKKNGQPYIYTLFYLKYPPEKYQGQATLSPLDEYGFGQIEGFDKFKFNFTLTDLPKNVAIVGFPEDFNGTNIKRMNVKPIQFNGTDMFWVYER